MNLIKKLSTRSPWLFRINAGSCNGCDVELATTACISRYDVERLGCKYCGSPRHADIVLITGPLTARVKDKVLRVWNEIPEPKVTVAVGICPISGGVFREGYSIEGPVDRYLPIDVNVPGCPPRPQAIMEGVLEAVAIWRERMEADMEFLKILWDNLKKGPVTDAFPFGETYTPDRLRGRVEIDPALCVGCGTCVHVCAAGAINISKFEDGSGFEITVWRNSCCLCAQCRHYCPTKAVTLTNDWHSAHRATEKYTQITRAKVKYDYCAVCGAKMRVLPQEVLNRIYAKHSEVDVDVISHLCPNCRRIDVAVEEDRACHIDQLEKMAAREEVCLVPPRKAEKASADKENAKEAPAQAASAPKTAAPSREATAQPKSDPAASKAAPSAQTPPAEQAASAAAETRPDTPSGTESAAEKPSPAAGNTAD